MRDLLPRSEIQERLEQIFPRDAFDPVHSNPLAAAAVAAMLYVDAVVSDIGELPANTTWARPTTCLWMNDAIYTRATSSADRQEWRKAAARGRRATEELEESWGYPHAGRWYLDNSRETLRDETFQAWLSFGALRDRPGIKTTSSQPRWAMTDSFAALFAPSLLEEELQHAIEQWRTSNMETGARVRIATLREREQRQHAVSVRLPDGVRRLLEPGDASLILKGVLENWAPARLNDPVVLSISEPGDKVYLADAARLRALGLAIDVGNLLPDALIADIGRNPSEFWIIEAVASDGPITEDRKLQLLRWARDQRIPAEYCYFLTAFLDRNSSASKRRLKDLAVGTFAWYASEPTRELAWYEIPSGGRA